MPESGNPQRDDKVRDVPRWQAPPPRRDATLPSLEPTCRPDRVAATTAAAPARRWPERLAPPLLIAMLLLFAALAGWPAVHAVVVHPQPAPTALASPPATRQALVPQADTGIGCFATLTLVEAASTPSIGRDAAEAKARDIYDLPLYPARLGTLIDARLMTLGYAPTSFGAPSIQATQAAAVRDRVAWLLSFSRTPPLDAPSAPATLPPATTAYFLYTLIDAATGDVIQSCERAGPSAEVAGQPLPPVPPERALRQSIDAARAAVPFPARAAGWLPFTAADSFARVNHLPAGQAEVVADYFAAGGSAVGARVRIISTPTPPLLATTDRGGSMVPLMNQRDARFDDLGAMQVLTWQDGTVWYQIIAVRPQKDGTPYTAADLLTIAAGLH